MLTYNSALIKDAYFCQICANSASILRYYRVPEILNMLDNMKKLEAEILSELSSLTAEMKLSADIMVKEQEEELFPLLSDILKKIQLNKSAVTQCYKSANAANLRVESAIRERLGGENGIIKNYAGAASVYKNEPAMRDAIKVLDLSHTLNTLYASQTAIAEDINKLESIRPKFMCRHYNILLKMKEHMNEKLSLLEEITSIIDAYNLALSIVNNLGGHQQDAIESLLNQSMSKIIDSMSRIYISSLKGEQTL